MVPHVQLSTNNGKVDFKMWKIFFSEAKANSTVDWQLRSRVLPLVVSIGHFPAFYVVFVPLVYIPTILPHSSYVIDICFVLFKKKEGPQHISSAFLTVQGRLNQQRLTYKTSLYLLFNKIFLNYKDTLLMYTQKICNYLQYVQMHSVPL